MTPNNQPEVPPTENCGIYGVNVSGKANLQPGHNTLICIACKEGFYPSENYTGNQWGAIKTCA